MGGFEGGDEGGFWDIDILPNLSHQQNTNKTKVQTSIERSAFEYSIKAYARVKSPSQWTRAEDLYDTITFVPCKCDTFTIDGCDNIPLESNTIYKAYHALNDFTGDSDILDFFSEHKVVVTKRIPLSAGLGGSSSDAAAFIHLAKEVCNLVLSTDELAKIGSSINTDVPFFIYLIA